MNRARNGILALLLSAVAFISCSLGSVTTVVSGDTFSAEKQEYSLGVRKYDGDGCILRAQFGLSSVNSAMVEKISDEEKPLHLYFDVDGKQIEVYKGSDFAFKVVTSGEGGKRVVERASWADEEGGGFAYRQGTGTVDSDGKAQIKWGVTRYTSKTGDRAEWLVMSKLYGEGTNSIGKLFATVTDKVTVDMLDMNEYEFNAATGYYEAPLSKFVKGAARIAGKGDEETIKAKFDIDGDLREFIGNGVEVDLEFADEKPAKPVAVASESESANGNPSGNTNPSSGEQSGGTGSNPSSGEQSGGTGSNPSSGEQSGGSDSTPWNGGVASGEIAYSLLVPFDGDFREIVYGNIGLDLKGAHDCYIDSSTGKSEYYSDNIHLLFRKGSEETDVVKGDNYIFLTYATNNGSERTIKSTYYASLEPGYLAYRVGSVNKDSKDGKFSVEWSGNWTSESKGDEVYRFIKTLFYMDCDVQTVFNMFYGDSTLDFRLNQLANKWEYTFHQTPQEEVKNTAQYWLCGIYKNKEDNDYLKGYDITVKYTNFVQGMCELDFKKTGVDGSEASLYISHTDKVTRPAFPEASYAFFGDCEEGDMYTSTGLYAASKGNATGLHGNSIKHEHYIEIGDIDDYVAMVENEKSNNPNKKSRALVLFYDGYDYDYDYLMDDAMPSCCNADRIEEEGSDAMCGGDNLMPYWTLMKFSSGNESDSTLWREKLDSDVRTFVVQVDGAKYKYASKKGGASVTASSQIIKDYSFLENFSSKSWYSGKENESYYENRMNFGFAELYSWLKYWSMDKNIPIYDNGNYMLNKENTGLTDEEKFELVNDIEEIKISRRVCNGAKNNFEDEFAFQLLNLCKYDWGGFADSKYEAIKRMNLETWLRKDNRGNTIQGVNGKNGIGEKVDRNAKFREPALVLFEDGVPVRAIGHCYLGHWKAQPFIKGEYNTWQVQLQDVEVINKK